MKTLKLIQEQGFTRYEFTLTEERLFIRQSTVSEEKEWSVRVEDIGYRSVIEKDTSRMKQILYISMGLFAIVLVIANILDHSAHMKTWVWMLLGCVYAWFATVVFLSPLNNKLLLTGGTEEVEFLSDKPSKKEVHSFVEEVVERSKKRIFKKYGPGNNEV